MKKPQHGVGQPGLAKAEWVTLARKALEETFETQLVMPHAELEARLWDQTWFDNASRARLRFFPHILTVAQQELEREGRIGRVRHSTKGTSTVDLLVTGNDRLRRTAITAAARRKGMLYARYDRWSSTFGVAGETVLTHSLNEAMARGDGYTPLNQDRKFGEVSRIGDLKFPGAVDNGAWQTVIDPATRMLLGTFLLLIEMKNRRLTLYPRHPEVYQLLFKAALATKQFPGQAIVPALICRRGHNWLFWMAKDLGFRVVQTKRQFVTLPDKTDRRYLTELHDELALKDLTPINGETPRIIDFFKSVLPNEAAAAAQRWRIMAPLVGPFAEQLRKETLGVAERSQLVIDLHLQVQAVFAHYDLGEPATWVMPPEDAYEDPTFL